MGVEVLLTCNHGAKGWKIKAIMLKRLGQKDGKRLHLRQHCRAIEQILGLPSVSLCCYVKQNKTNKTKNKIICLVYFLLGIQPVASQSILTGTLSKNRSSSVVGIGSDATVEFQLNRLSRGETMTRL